MTAALVVRDGTEKSPGSSDVPDWVHRMSPVDPDLLELVLDGLRALQSQKAHWRPGFLSCLLHAVPAEPDEWKYLGQTIQWSACGAPVLNTDITAGRVRCPKCMDLAGYREEAPPSEPAG